MIELSCDICNAPMVLEKRLSTITHRGRRHRRRLLKCTFCDFKKVIWGDGDADEKSIPDRGIDEVKRMFKQEEENRNN
jgi:hypothetical protein